MGYHIKSAYFLHFSNNKFKQTYIVKITSEYAFQLNIGLPRGFENKKIILIDQDNIDLLVKSKHCLLSWR